MAEENGNGENDTEPPTFFTKIRSGTVGIGLGTLLVGTCMAKVCVVDGIEDRLDNVNASLQAQTTYQPRLKKQNVIGELEPEEFYEVDGKRAYVIIDGKPVETYLLHKSTLERVK